LLDRHPSVGLCRPKEPAWFSGGKLARSDDEYLSLFPQDKPLWVDGSTAYSFPEHASEVAQRIHEHNPDAKFIFVVRNPVKRVISTLNHGVLENETTTDIEATVNRAVKRTAYHSAISPYLRHISKKAILVTSMDSLFADDGRQILAFLNLKPTPKRGALRPVNHTSLRRKENFLTHWYRRNWRSFNRLPVPHNVRRWLSAGFTRTFMRPPAPSEFHQLSEAHIRKIRKSLESDARMFEADFHFNYLTLDK
jgi:hypothetical protein